VADVGHAQKSGAISCLKRVKVEAQHSPTIRYQVEKASDTGSIHCLCSNDKHKDVALKVVSRPPLAITAHQTDCQNEALDRLE